MFNIKFHWLCEPRAAAAVSGKPLKLPLRSGVLLGLDLAEDFVGDVVLEAAAYAVDLDGRERAATRRGGRGQEKKLLRIQARSLSFHSVLAVVNEALCLAVD